MHLSGEKAIMAFSTHSIELKKKQHKVNAYVPQVARPPLRPFKPLRLKRSAES